MFPEDVEGEPKLDILEHPKSRGFRFRYTCEGPSHGGIPGASSDKNKKTFPAVRIVNYQGYARIVVQLVTNEENPRLHPHSLVGKQCQNGICTVQCGPKDMTATFPNLGIQHVTKKNVASILEERYIAAEMQLSSINDGFPQEVQRNIKDEDRKRIAAKAQSEAKSIDLSVVRLMFIAYLPDSQGAFTIMLKPIISEAIFDSKAPNAATLKICRMDCNAGSASGNDEVYLLCDKVQKDDIQVRFIEEDAHGRELWENYGSFCPTDVHRQFAIVFRTPPYKDQYISQPVNVNVQLRRKSDGEVSEARTFTYLPNKTDFDMIERKRRKVIPDYLENIGGNNSQGFNFSGSSSGGNSVQSSFQFEGASGSSNDNVKKNMSSPPLSTNKKLNPQKGPIEPWVLSGKPNPLDTQAAPVHVKQEYCPGTLIPLPPNVQQWGQSRTRNVPSCSNAAQANQISRSPNQQFPVPIAISSQPITSMRNSNTVTSSSNYFTTAHVNAQIIEGLAANVETLSTEQVFSSSDNRYSNASQVAWMTNASTSRTGNDVSGMNTSLSSDGSQGNQSTRSLLTNDDVFDLIDDIEIDGAMTETKESKEYDFAAALWDDESFADATKVPSDHIKTPAVSENDDLESDSAALVKDFQSLSLKGYSLSRDFSLRPKSEKIGDSKAESIGDGRNTKNFENFISSYKLTQAKAMATAMHEYSMTGDVRALLSRQGHLASTTDQNGDTVLHHAVINNQLEVLGSVLDVVALLGNRDEILNCKNNDSQTALQIASLSDNTEAVIQLLKFGAEALVPDRNGNHSVHVASRHGNADILSRLLNSKHANERKFDTRNHNGLGCYHLAVKAKQNQQQCLLLLRDHYCDVDLQDARSGRTPLHMAVELEKSTVVELLISECDANVHARTFDGHTPLHLAAASGRCEIASLLLAHGASPDAACGSSTEEMKTAADLAQTDDMRDVLSGKLPLFNFVPESDTNQSHSKNILFDRTLRDRFFELLNAEKSETNWYKLAERLQIPSENFSQKVLDNPVASLLHIYWLSHGTVDGLRSALMNMGRHDVVQLLNRCVHSKTTTSWQNQEKEIY